MLPLICGITVYRPDRGLLLGLLDRLAGEGLQVVAYIDGPPGEAIDAALLAEVEGRRGLGVIVGASNQGIGAGLNRLVAEAQGRGARRLLVFDQDSGPMRGLAAALTSRMDALTAAGERPAAIGPRPVSPDRDHKAPHYRPMPGRRRRVGASTVRYLISSGTLLDLDAFAAVGPFRADYVIDAIDIEWCFRAWSHGRSVWLANDLAMEHRVGVGIVRFGPLRFPQQSPARMATYLRNQAHCLRLAHVPIGWKLRNIVYLPLQIAAVVARGPDRLRTLVRSVRAIRDGLAGRLGPLSPPGA